MGNNKVYDIAIIGLGPAGSTFARLLDKRYSVIAFDKKTEDKETSFKKPCGGLLAEDAQKFFSKFGLTLPLEVLVDPQIFSVKTIDVNTKNIRYYQRFYVNMDRHKFDLWLKSLILSNVDIKNDVICTNIEKNNGIYYITVLKDNQELNYKAKYIVGADGANSLVRKILYPKKKIKSYISIQQWFEDKHEQPFYSCIFDSHLTDCYSWGLSKNGKFIFGGAFPMKNGKQNFELLKQKVQVFDFHLENPIKTEACLVLRPVNPFQFCCGKDNTFLIGEAAGFISPSSLEGISYAFESAYILSNLFNSNKTVSSSKYNMATLPIKLKLILKLLKNPFMYNEFLRTIVMKSGYKSIKMISNNK